MKLRIKGNFAFLENASEAEVEWFEEKLTWEQYSGKPKSILYKTETEHYTYKHLAQVLKSEAAFNVDIVEDPNDKFEKPTIKVDPDCLKGITLYGYQVKAVKKFIRGREGILKLSTGAGKGNILLAVLKHLEFDQAVIIVPTTVLADDLFNRALKYGFKKSEVGVVSGTKKQFKKIIFAVAASVDSAIKRRTKLTNHLNKCDILIADECQHAASNSWKRIWLTSQAKYKIGLSASPFTTIDGYELATYQDASVVGVLGPLLYDVPSKLLVKMGKISKTYIHYISLKGRRTFYPIQMAKLHKKEIIDNVQRNKEIIECAKKAVGYKFKVLILVQQHQHAEALMKKLHGYKVICKFGGTKSLQFNEHDDIEELPVGPDWAKRFQNGEWDILIGTSVMDEGVDVSSIGFMILGGGGKCLTGDTKISLLDGTERRVDSLVGEKEFWVYSSKPDGTIVPGKGHSARVTKTVRALCHITLDNDEVIKCTPDHKFMLRDGTYREAQYLKPEDSLMPLYRKVGDSDKNKGYEYTLQNSSRQWQKTHSVVGEFVKGISETWQRIKENKWKDKHLVIHHKDFNKRNNSPENLQWMGENEHWKYHSSLISKRNTEKWKEKEYRRGMTLFLTKILQSPETRKKAQEGLRKKWSDPKYQSKMSEVAKESILSRLEDPDFLQQCTENLKEGNRLWWSKEENREAHSERMKDYMKDPDNLSFHLSELQKGFENFRKSDQWEKHTAMLSEKAKGQWEDKEFQKMHSEKMKEHNRKLWSSEEFRQKHVERSSKIISGLNKDPNFQKKCQLGKVNKLISQIEDQGLKLDKDNYEKIRASQKFPGSWPKWESFCKLTNFNHKVKNVDLVNLESPIPVYDITVDDYHNFALSSGVFVHNSLRQQIQRRGRGSRLKEVGENAVYLVDFIDRAHVYLYSHYVKRRAIFLETGSEMVDDKFKFWRKVAAHAKAIQQEKERLANESESTGKS